MRSLWSMYMNNGAGAQPILTRTSSWKPRLETIQEVRALSRRRFHNFVRWRRRSSHKSAQSLEDQKGILSSMAHTFWACKSHQFTSHVWCICWAPLVPCVWTQTLNSGPLPLLLQVQKLLAFQVQDIQLEAIMIFKAPNHSSLYGVKMVPIPLEAHANFIRVTVAAETSSAQSGFMRDVWNQAHLLHYQAFREDNGDCVQL